MRRATHRLAVACIVLNLPLVALAKDVYISKSGNDSHAGTKEKPLATVEKAVDSVRPFVSNRDTSLERGRA